MKIVLTGHFESAFVRMHDEETHPDRNTTGLSYYMDLNRNTDRIYRDGASTFIALAERTTVPWELDWGGPGDLASKCGITRSADPKQDLEWQQQYDVVQEFIADVIRKDALSAKSLSHITGLDLSGYPEEIARTFVLTKPSEQSDLVAAYLRRLLHQIYAAQGQQTYLLVAEPEVRIIADLGEFLVSGGFRRQIPFPDLRGRLIDTEALLDGVLAFSPPDISSLEAVKRNPEVQHYAERVSNELKRGAASDLTLAAVEAYRSTEAGKRTDRVFEALTWVAKPIHYIPGLDAVMTVAEDAKDLAIQAARWRMRYSDWHLIGVKMQTISTEDFFKRLSNRYPQ
jgi:hypothetical protein